MREYDIMVKYNNEYYWKHVNKESSVLQPASKRGVGGEQERERKRERERERYRGDKEREIYRGEIERRERETDR